MIKLFSKPSKQLPFDPINLKANEINLIQGKRPYMRAFHFSWFSFCVAFTGWFAIAPLLPHIIEDLHITDAEAGNSNITNVTAAILFRVLVGPLCDRMGPKRVMSILLILGAIPVGLSALVHSATGLIVVRFFIGILGATFVPCQFWTTQMFNGNIVGSANALAGGWGNLGAGLTTILMALVADGFESAGLSVSLSWRVSLVIPAVLCFTVGVCNYFFTDDCPQGDWSQHVHLNSEVHNVSSEIKNIEVHDANKVVKNDSDSEKNINPASSRPDLKTCLAALTNPNVWILMVQYACCFGVELAVDGALTLFFFNHKEFGLTKKDAGLIAALFGLMNIFSRATGGFTSDFANEKMGIRGRFLAQFFVVFLEGLFLFVFRFSLNSLTEAIIILILFSYFTQAACGTTFGIVPFVDTKIVGAVSGLVGAGGSIGGVIFTTVFKVYGSFTPMPFMVLGITVMIASLLTFLLRIDNTMLINFKRN